MLMAVAMPAADRIGQRPAPSAVKCTALQRLADKADSYVGQAGNLGVLIALDVVGQRRRYVTAGHRDLARTIPLDKDALYQIGSQTKTLVAWALLLLQRDAKIRLDDPVVRHVDLPIDPRITIRQLLLNTSGLGEYTSLLGSSFFDARVAPQPRDLLSLALPGGQMFAPGERFDYCNTGWLVAAMLIDAVTGSYAGFVRERIFEPLGLHDSFVGTSGWPRHRAAHGYVRSGPGDRTLSANDEASFSWAYGAGDVVSCCDDMLDLYAALRDPDNATGISLADLTAETSDASKLRKVSVSLGVEYAYGLERRFWAGRPVWGHAGRTLGYGAATWTDIDAGVTVTSCVTWLLDFTEPVELRYPGPQLFTLALATGYSLAGL